MRIGYLVIGAVIGTTLGIIVNLLFVEEMTEYITSMMAP